MSIQPATLDVARGAFFHAAAAEPLLECLGRGVAGDAAAAIESTAMSHLTHAVRDIDVTIAAVGTSDLDARTGALLRSARAGLVTAQGTTTGSVEQLDALRSASRQAHLGMRELVTAAGGDPAWIPSRSVGELLPLEERRLVTTAEGARLMRRTNPNLLDDVREALQDGERVPGTQRWLGADGVNFNGKVEMVDVTDPANPARHVPSVHKGPGSQAAQEEFVYQLARELGVDHLLPTAVRRADGSVVMEVAKGTPFYDAGIRSAGDIDRLLTDHYQRLFPSLSRDEAGRAARTDRELLQVLDYLTANNDRHVANGMADWATGDLELIDHGFAGRGETADPLVPELKWFYQGADGHTELHEDTIATLRGVDRNAIGRAHAVLRASAGGVGEDGLSRLNQDRADTYLARINQRLDHAIDTGGYDYRPIGDADHPLGSRGRPALPGVDAGA